MTYQVKSLLGVGGVWWKDVVQAVQRGPYSSNVHLEFAKLNQKLCTPKSSLGTKSKTEWYSECNSKTDKTWKIWLWFFYVFWGDKSQFLADSFRTECQPISTPRGIGTPTSTDFPLSSDVGLVAMVNQNCTRGISFTRTPHDTARGPAPFAWSETVADWWKHCDFALRFVV